MEGSPAPPDLLARAREQKPDYADGQKLLVKEGRLTPIHLVECGIQNLNWACLVHSGSQENKKNQSYYKSHCHLTSGVDFGCSLCIVYLIFLICLTFRTQDHPFWKCPFTGDFWNHWGESWWPMLLNLDSWESSSLTNTPSWLPNRAEGSYPRLRMEQLNVGFKYSIGKEKKWIL